MNLKECPGTPNCVCSMYYDEWFIEPIETSLNLLEIRDKILTMKRVKLIKQGYDYLKFEFTTFFFRFVDDVEIVLEDSVLHIRSASRVGHSDLGKNRKRVEEIRKLLLKNS